MRAQWMRFGAGALGGIVRLLSCGLLGLFDWKQRPFRALLVCLVLILLITGLPVINILISSVIASALGCRLDEGSVHPCLFVRMDLGDLLYFLFVSGWFAVLTIPVGVMLILVWLIVAVVFAIKHLHAGRQT